MAVFGEIWKEKQVIAGRWTLRDVVQGKPMGHPTHAMLVHFPSALFPVAFVLYLVSAISADLTVARAGFYNIGFGLGFAGLAAVTGLVDYVPMLGGKDRRRLQLGTLHMLTQIAAVALMTGAFVVHAFDYNATQAPWAAVVLAGAGAAVIGAGNYLGGLLVYKEGMRVREGDPDTDAGSRVQ